jgi:3-hydroxyacyl-[acyl-carrier-protein] dehydratase
MRTLSGQAITAILPHRPPMLLVDWARLDGEAEITARKTVTEDEPCFVTEPQRGVAGPMAYPLSLIVESFAQAGLILWKAVRGTEAGDAGGIPLFGSLKDASVAGEAFPGDVLEHRIRLDKAMPDAAFLSGETLVGQRRILTVGLLVAVARPAS